MKPLREKIAPAKGRVKITIRSGEEIRELFFNNLIVNGMRKVLPHLTGQADASYRVSQFKIGTGTTAANATDTDLETPVDIDGSNLKAITSNSYPNSPNEVSTVYVLDVEDSEANSGGPHNITECGLFTANGIMVSRVVFAPIVKNNTTSFSLQWEHVF